ncbi:hypothetical protein RHSIM_Rhsim02G0010000 [Rhododendron simsii]|uniref:Cullin N-terminal domain-containing protein n=1 Tax=Rhododendron simsii TaxID=118357 RepID=A0A834HPG8_RHOSS|nr:hypothetical protein RHSIM_Rhsim02G0010000 [Rhododendron simsii]
MFIPWIVSLLPLRKQKLTVRGLLPPCDFALSGFHLLRKVLPVLREKKDENLLIENVKESRLTKALVKNILDIHVEFGEGSMKYYAKDFEEAMLKDTASFYSKKASIWIASLSYRDYMRKVEECIKQERDRGSNYLQSRSRHELLEVVEHELLSVYSTKLEEKKQAKSENCSLEYGLLTFETNYVSSD